MHAALDAHAGEHPSAPEDDVPERGAAPSPGRRGVAALSVAALLLAVSLSLADGLLGDTIAFERDTTAFYLPLMTLAGQRLHQGELPLWVPSVFGGYPLFADGEIGLAYPPALLALLLVPAERALVLLRLLHLAIAALGTFLLARAWRLPYAAATLAGVVFALGSFLQAQIHHENIVRSAAWLPLILACAERGLRARRPARTAWTAATALAVGMAGLSLHTQLLAMDLLMLALYGALRLWAGPIGAERGWRTRLASVAAVFSAAAALGMALSAVQLLPLAELARFSPRGGGIPYAESAAYSLTPYSLVQLVVPFAFRTPTNEQWGLWTHWESYLYVGLAPLVLALVALVCVRRRDVALWAIMGAIGLVLALGQYSPVNLHYLLWLMPGMAGLRAPGRFSLAVVLAAAMLAAYGLTWLRAAAQDGVPRAAAHRFRVLLAGVAALPPVLAVVSLWAHRALLDDPLGARALIGRWYLGLPHDSYPLTASDVYAGLLDATDLLTNTRATGALVGLAGVAVALLVWHAWPRPAVRGWAGWPGLLVAGSTVDLLLFSWSIHPRASLAELSRADPAATAVHHAGGSADDTFRVLASPVIDQVAPNRLVTLGLEDVAGYSSLQPLWHDALLRRVRQVDDALLDLWNVRYVLDPARYGQLATYQGVNFLPQQMILHGVAGSALGSATFRLEPTTPRGVGLVSALVDALDVPQDATVGEVELRGVDGALVATYPLRAGRDSMEWASDDPVLGKRVQHHRVEVAGVALESGSTRRVLSYTHVALDSAVPVDSMTIRATRPHGELLVFGAAVESVDGTRQQLLGRHQDKYRPVYADGRVAVFENTAAFPRAFVVPRARVVTSLGAAEGAMTREPFDPAAEVILAPGAGDAPPGIVQSQASPPLATGPLPAVIERSAANDESVRVASPTDGFLVVSDTFYPGWRAWVDGVETPVLRGDLLFRVVQIPAGEHVVRFAFDPESVKVGLIASAAALAILCGMLAAPVARQDGRRRQAAWDSSSSRSRRRSSTSRFGGRPRRGRSAIQL